MVSDTFNGAIASPACARAWVRRLLTVDGGRCRLRVCGTVKVLEALHRFGVMGLRAFWRVVLKAHQKALHDLGRPPWAFGTTRARRIAVQGVGMPVWSMLGLVIDNPRLGVCHRRAAEYGDCHRLRINTTLYECSQVFFTNQKSLLFEPHVNSAQRHCQSCITCDGENGCCATAIVVLLQKKSPHTVEKTARHQRAPCSSNELNS